MQPTHAFLDVLGLDERADARAIRRAYARHLKGIDQGADAAGFQVLREAYETALAWAAYQEHEQVQEDACAHAQARPDSAVPEAAPPDEVRLAAVVGERFEAGARALAQAGRLADPDAWHALLLARLRDEELINIGARTRFEWQVVYLLGSGWRPGHEALFPAAVAAFEWADDRRRLAQFDYFGHLLNAAIDERALFDSQAIAVRSVQERIAMLLRREQQADPREIVQSMAELCKMQDYFPALLTVVANADNVAYWHAQFPASQVVEEQRIERRNRGWDGLFIVIVIAIAAFFAYHSYSGPPVPGSMRARNNPVEPVFDPRANPPDQALLQQQVPPLRYSAPPDAKPGDYTVEFEVFLDADGNVIGMNKLQESQLPGFDEAFEASLRASKPFPAATARIFKAGITARIVAQPKRRGPGATTQV